MTETINPDIPQTFDALMQAVSNLPEEHRFETLICVWFNSPADGEIGTVAASYHPIEPKCILDELAATAGFDGDWNRVLIIGGRSVNGVPPGQAQVDNMIGQVLQRLAGGGFTSEQDAIFDRAGDRINEIDFPASLANQ